MDATLESRYETLHRWQWFQRAQWLGSFREWKRGSPLAFGRVIDEITDENGGAVLDSSCGLGLKTIVMKELGLDVSGSDGCGFAVEKARELAAAEGLDIEYFVSCWEELPVRTDRRFDGIFNDALSWIATREEFTASLRGFLGALRAGGALVFFGAGEGSPSDPESRRRFFEDYWLEKPRFSLEWSHAEAGTRCTSICVREKGDMYVDEHRLFLVEEGGVQRLETATIRQPAYWHWEALQEMFRDAGFSRLQTRSFDGLGLDGGAIKLNVATK